MTDPNSLPQPETSTPETMNPLRCVTGAIISGGLGYAIYSLMISIATNFASKPIHSDNQLVVRITSAVRTLVVGVFALGAGVFGIVALGLLALAVQMVVQKLTKAKEG
ncbi:MULTISPECIES: DUF3082 domain-containing protein [unclassified Tolypothrix]|uniref:DUF3082 domain-containing protein n=1 Tax=unclassified Tolypothrix TaxID=2649714 RepID=UPI0005F79199|nr:MULTISPECIES: DUF3082 domain-containing protein [unclassified Tolypothrix]MBE9082815.1 DUF3082 domain-containing protein [Tolypothrix sp. LEGE 11397]UYD23583.1 DUF3082 domain-containing protein [Tolypothrix sp. PCC 7712]UYD34189.1 DUF3082 domain-containing protein [Tolypothrix sp. PCC 7601]BAY89304.1 hypothetical protein NIES3275_13070 [Microchaete diplosiphon NIES-3275]